MVLFKSKFLTIIIVNLTLLIFLISRFNQKFLLFEYSYEPLFVLNFIIIVLGIIFKSLIDKKLNLTLFEVLVYVLTIWLIINLTINLNEHSLNGINIGRILNVVVPMLYVTLLYLWKDNITKENIIRVIGFMILIAATIGFTALITILFPNFMITLFDWDTNNITRGTISPINNGTFLALLIIPSISLFIYYEKSKTRYLFLLCFILILLGLISTGRRGSYFPALLMIIVFFIILISKNFTKEGLKRYIKYFVIVTVLLIMFTINLINTGDIGRLFGQVDNKKENIGRLIRMEPALNFIKYKPLVGDGIGNYYYRVSETHMPDIDSVNYTSWIQLSDPHNTYLMVTAESGIIGLIIFMSILIYILRRLKPHDVISLGIVLGIIVFLINCLVDTRLWKGLVRIDAVFWILVGLGIIYNQKLKTPTQSDLKK